MRTTPVETIRLYEERGWWGDRTFMDVFDEAVAEAPDAAALVDPPNRESFVAGAPRRLTFREVSDHADALALLLRALEVGGELFGVAHQRAQPGGEGHDGGCQGRGGLGVADDLRAWKLGLVQRQEILAFFGQVDDAALFYEAHAGGFGQVLCGAPGEGVGDFLGPA